MKVIKIVMNTGDTIRYVAPPEGMPGFLADLRIAVLEGKPLLSYSFNDSADLLREAGAKNVENISAIYINPSAISYFEGLVTELPMRPVTDELRKVLAEYKAKSQPQPAGSFYAPSSGGGVWDEGKLRKVGGGGMTREEMIAAFTPKKDEEEDQS